MHDTYSDSVLQRLRVAIFIFFNCPISNLSVGKLLNEMSAHRMCESGMAITLNLLNCLKPREKLDFHPIPFCQHSNFSSKRTISFGEVMLEKNQPTLLITLQMFGWIVNILWKITFSEVLNTFKTSQRVAWEAEATVFLETLLSETEYCQNYCSHLVVSSCAIPIHHRPSSYPKHSPFWTTRWSLPPISIASSAPKQTISSLDRYYRQTAFTTPPSCLHFAPLSPSWITA